MTMDRILPAGGLGPKAGTDTSTAGGRGMSAPERIWAWAWEVNPNMGQWEVERSIVGDGTPYVLEAAITAARAEIARLKAERDAAMAGRVKVKPLVWEPIGKLFHAFDDLFACMAISENPAAYDAERSAKVAANLQPDTERAEPVAFQGRVQPWMMNCFGPEVSGDRLERADRLLEEVLELLQSGAYPPERVASLTAYVWSRPAGEPAQEVGGVMVTLAAYCLAHNLDMHAAGEAELSRVWTKVDKIRAKQAAKPKGSALPQAWPDTTPQPAPAPQAREITVQEALAELRYVTLEALGSIEEGYCLNLSGISSRTDLPRETLRGVIADLRADGLVNHIRGLQTEDGEVCGAGYAITDAGTAALRAIAAMQKGG